MSDPRESFLAAGYDIGELLGSGMEGTVAVLDDDRVVKLWDRRTRADVDRLQTFYDAVAGAGFALPVPRILEVSEVDGLVVTVQARLHGSAPTELDPGLDVVALDVVALVVDVLAALVEVEVHPDMAVLPVPAGEPPFGADVPFATSLAGLVERRAELLPRGDDAGVVARIAADLRGLSPSAPALVHGDLGLGNLLVLDGRPCGLLDFGYVSTVGDPAFDAAVAAALHRMLGPGDAAGTAAVDRLTTERFGYDAHRLSTYRAAYGLITASCLVDHPGPHLTWCLALMARQGSAGTTL